MTGEPKADMPHLLGTDLRGSTASLRASYTGEREVDAAAALRSGGTTTPLDTCSESQRRLRALLAVLLLNNDPSGTVIDCGLSGLLNTGLVLSPRFDEFVLLTDDPQRVVRLLLPGDDGHLGLPGLRPMRTDEERGGFVFRHPPSRALLRVAPTRARRISPPTEWLEASRSARLTSIETQVSATVPAMHPDAMRLLGALASRLTMRHPAGRWAVGKLTWDPLAEFRVARTITEGPRQYRLTGAGADWSLRWSGGMPVPPGEVAIGLTDSFAGLPGAVAMSGERGLEVHFREARLALLP
ncbi:hypothetical protein D5S17_00330 [Pseudonocardiaceae bacterium YIM PH 21723]|nr:hypothetical protein D5S17_00330 [Pseudonocardiaceae bacterium YIM PH 21723]